MRLHTFGIKTMIGVANLEPLQYKVSAVALNELVKEDKK